MDFDKVVDHSLWAIALAMLFLNEALVADLVATREVFEGNKIRRRPLRTVRTEVPCIPGLFNPVFSRRLLCLFHACREGRAQIRIAPASDRFFNIGNGAGRDSLGEIENKFRVVNRAKNFYDIAVARIRRDMIDDGIFKDCILATRQEAAP